MQADIARTKCWRSSASSKKVAVLCQPHTTGAAQMCYGRNDLATGAVNGSQTRAPRVDPIPGITVVVVVTVCVREWQRVVRRGGLVPACRCALAMPPGPITPGRMESIARQRHQQTARQLVELSVSGRPREF